MAETAGLATVLVGVSIYAWPHLAKDRQKVRLRQTES